MFTHIKLWRQILSSKWSCSCTITRALAQLQVLNLSRNCSSFPKRILKHFFCNLNILSILYWEIPPHTDMPYRRWDSKIVKYIVLRFSLAMYGLIRLIIAIAHLSRLYTTSVCAFQISFLSKVTPKNFTSSTITFWNEL